MHPNYLKDQQLRTRLFQMELAAHVYLTQGDDQQLRKAMSNNWMHTIGEAMSDPFATIRLLAHRRDEIKHEWSEEVKALHAAGFSLRTIAEAAGVSHDTVWKRVRG